MKDDFLTIPDCSKYEINSEFVVRHKRLKKIRKSHFDPRYNDFIYSLIKNDGNIIRRTAKHLRRLAESAVESAEWFPVPSLQNLYEINKYGHLRRVLTKRKLKIRGGCYSTTIDKKVMVVSRNSLMWEVFGITRKTPGLKKPCTLSKGNRILCFDSLADTAKFLAEKYFYSIRTILDRLIQRTANICGWKVTYLDAFTPNLRWLGREGRRNKKTWAQYGKQNACKEPA